MSTTRRTTSRPRSAPTRAAASNRRRSRRQHRPTLTPEQWRDVGGVLLAGFGLLSLLSLIVHHAPLLDGLRGLVLGAVGLGWPLVLGSVIATGVLMVWPTPPVTPAPKGSRTERDEDDDGDHTEPTRAPVQQRAPSWLEVVVGLVAMLAVLGILSLASAPAGGAVGRLALLTVSPAGSLGGLLILLLLLVLAAIVVVKLSPGRASLAAVAASRAAYAGRGRVLGPLPALAARLARPVTELLRTLRLMPAESPREKPAAVPAPAAARGVVPGVVEKAAVAVAEPPVPVGADQELRLEDGVDGDTQDAVGTDDLDDEAEAARRSRTDWVLPGLSLLQEAGAPAAQAQDEIKRVSRIIVGTLATFGVEVKVVGVNSGPAVTRYALQPAAGVPVRKVVSLQNDLTLALAAESLRIEAPIPGQAAIGIEVPNKTASLVTIREVVESPAFRRGHVLAVVLGKDVAGRAAVGDLTLMPHVLLAGATGQGKSVCINTLVCSLLLRLDPSQLLLVMIDPKRVELQGYSGLPHLAVPVIVDPHQAASALRWAVGEMERRYKLLAAAGCRNIASYNPKAVAAGEEPLPYVVIVIDELADLMMVAAGEVEELICRIAQLARAVGIHLVIATQRPSADIITGLIRANVPSRVAFAVGSQVDSRVILDAVGAEKLLGRGDMLYKPVDAGRPVRLQGAFIADREVEDLVGFWKAQGEPRYLEGVLDAAPISPVAIEGGEDRQLDPLFARAARAVAAEGAASVSLVQRKLNVGYSRAGRIVDQLAEHRVIGPYQGSKSREVLMNLPDIDELLERLGVEG